MTENTQAVAPEAEAVQGQTEVKGAQGDTSETLDSFLNEYESQTKPTAPKPEAKTDNTQYVPKAEFDALRAQILAKQDRADLDQAINDIKGDADIEDWAVRGWISSKAEADPRLNQIWDNRHSDPRAAKKLISSLKSEFNAERSKRPDKNATEDREAVAAAVRGASSTKAPEGKGPDYGSMSKADFERELAKYT